MSLALVARHAAQNPRPRAVLDSIFAQPEYLWQDRADPFAPLRRAWHWLMRYLDSLRADSPLLYRGLIAVLVIVLLVIFGHAAWVMYRTMRVAAAREVEQDMARREVRDAAWYAREAGRLAREGRYAESIEADFQRLMLQLDARALVRFHPSRTPNEYVREPGLSPAARHELSELVRRLYAYVFARVPCGPAELEEWRAHASLERYAAA